MNYFDLPEYATLAPFETVTGSRPSSNHVNSASPLERLVASIHRRNIAPQGYRYVANIDAADLARAMLAVKYASIAGELRLITSAVDNAGNAVSDIALYVRDHLPEPESFWSAFRSPVQSSAA